MAFSTIETLFSGELAFGALLDQGDGTTLTETAGSNRYLVIEIAHGSLSTTPIIPTSITVGGQSLTVIQQESNPASEGSNDMHVGVAVANEATIAAMTFTAGEANWSITFLADNDHKVNVRALFYTDIDQTAGVVDSDVSGDTSNNRTVSLTVAVDDFVIGLGVVRASGTISSTDTVRGTALDASGAGTATWPESLVSELTATGTSQDITISTSIGAFAAMVALALRPVSAGGPEAITADLSTSFSIGGAIADTLEHIFGELGTTFAAAAGDFTVYISKFITLVTSFNLGGSFGSLPAAISATLTSAFNAAAGVSSLIQRISGAVLSTAFSLGASVSNVTLLDVGTYLVKVGVDFVQTGAAYITSTIRSIINRY